MTINFHQIKQFFRHYLTARRNGHGIHSPFGFLLCEEVFYNNNSFYDFTILDSVRDQLLVNENTILIEDFGVGSKTFKGNYRKIKDIALKGISSKKQSEFFYRLINLLKCQTSVELGTSIGLNTLYLSKANKAAQIFSIEGSRTLADFASSLAKQTGQDSIKFIHGKFDEVLPHMLEKIINVDFAYVDGNHSYEATMRYFNLLLEKKQTNSVYIFDDIYWSPSMTKAWKEIKTHPSVTLSIDTFYFGIIFFKEELKEKIELKLYV